MCNLFTQFRMDLERLIKHANGPSRPLDTLLIKTKRDISELESFGNKGRKSKKEQGIKSLPRSPQAR